MDSWGTTPAKTAPFAPHATSAGRRQAVCACVLVMVVCVWVVYGDVNVLACMHTLTTNDRELNVPKKNLCLSEIHSQRDERYTNEALNPCPAVCDQFPITD